MFSLDGTTALVIGIANANSIAYGCAAALKAQGAKLAVTYLNEKARPHVEPLAERLGAEIFLPLDVRDEAQADALFDEITETWGRLDTLLHSTNPEAAWQQELQTKLRQETISRRAGIPAVVVEEEASEL